MRTSASAWLLSLAVASLGCSEDASKPSGGTVPDAAADAAVEAGPLWPSDGFVLQSPEEQGMDAAILEGARDYAFQEGKDTQGVVVVRRGALVAEWYAEGASKDSWAASWSMAKSFTSALVGMALEEGAIPSLDVSMAEYYPSWKGTEREAITLRDVLTMSSGLDWDEDYAAASYPESEIIQLVLKESDQLAFASERPAAHEPGSTFNYSSGDALLLSGVLEQATGMRAGEYARQKLFDPLGLDPADWWTDAAGHTLTYCCIDTTSRGFARFGLLYLRRGRWKDREIVPAQWVADSTKPSATYAGYGYQWWLTGRTRPELPMDTFSARGHDGQFIYVIPSLELVAVRNGRYIKFDGEPVADPILFERYPSDGINPRRGTFPPDSWSDVEFLTPILDSVVDK